MSLADDALVVLLHVVAKPRIRLAIHDPIADPGRMRAPRQTADRSPGNRETHQLLDEDVPSGDHHDLPGGQRRQQEHRADRRRSPAVRNPGFPRSTRPAPAVLPGPPAHGRARSCADRSRRSRDRARRLSRTGSKSNDVAVIPVHARFAVETVAITGVEPELQRKREHLLRLQQRKRRTIGAPVRAVHRKRQLFPLDVVASDEVTVLGDDVIARDRPSFGRKCCAVSTSATVVLDANVLPALHAPDAAR